MRAGERGSTLGASVDLFRPAPELPVGEATVAIEGTALPLQKVTVPTKELQRVWVTDPA